jgi:hypothetical protein
VTNGELNNGGARAGDPGGEQIKIIRIRHFFEFDTPLILKRSEEITFCNEGDIELTNVIYYAREFLPHLNVYDSNGEQLIFHGEINDSDEEVVGGGGTTDPSEETSTELPIIIEFPKNRGVAPTEFRTITLKYINDFGLDKNNRISFIELPVGFSQNFYLYIKRLDEYITKIDSFIGAKKESDPNDTDYFLLDELREHNFVSTEDTPTYFRMSSAVPIPNCNLIIIISYEMTFPNVLWFNGGVIVGMGVLMVNLVMMDSDIKNFLPCIITLGALSNTYLILTRGWIFTKNPVERILFSDYSSIYFLLILCIFIEVFLACFMAVSAYGFTIKI